MASRKMTFSLPSELATQFIRRIPARDRSRYLAEVLAEKLGERERNLARACEIANRDPDVLAIEQEFDLVNDPLSDPWEPPNHSSPNV